MQDLGSMIGGYHRVEMESGSGVFSEFGFFSFFRSQQRLFIMSIQFDLSFALCTIALVMFVFPCGSCCHA